MRDTCVAIAGSGNITGLNIARALAGEVTTMIGYDYTSPESNPTSMFCKNFQVPSAASSTYCVEVIKLVKEHKVKAIIASNDHDVRALLRIHSELAELGIVVNAFGPNTQSFLNKETTRRLFDGVVLTPDVYTEDTKEIPYVVRKTSVGLGKKFTHIVRTPEDESKLPKEFFHNSIITKFIQGDEYTVDVLCNNSSDVLITVPRLRREVRAGIVHFGEVVEQPRVISQTKNLAERLRLTGINCVQCIVDHEGKCYFFEINPRPGSGLDLTTHAGANMPLLWLDEVLGNDQKIPVIDWGLKMVRFHDGHFFK